MAITNPAAGSGVYGDGRGAYVDNQSGVSAQLQQCNGYYDAVIQLGTSAHPRSFIFNFTGAELYGVAGQTPGWVISQPVFAAEAFINIKNVANNSSEVCPGPACYNPSADYTFTTFAYIGNITGPRAPHVLKHGSSAPYQTA